MWNVCELWGALEDREWPVWRRLVTVYVSGIVYGLHWLGVLSPIVFVGVLLWVGREVVVVGAGVLWVVGVYGLCATACGMACVSVGRSCRQLWEMCRSIRN